MSEQNVEIVRALYRAFEAQDPGAAFALMSPDIVWNEAENFPYSDRNPYEGPQAIGAGVFARLAGEWDGFAAVAEEYLDAGDTVVVLGRYRGARKQTGKPIDAQMVHVWRIADGRIAAFQQYVDTLQVARAMEAG